MPTEDQRQIYELKSRLFKLEAQVDFLYKHLGVTFVEDIHASNDPNVVKALRAGNVLDAIKAYRLKTNAGLEEAKIAVEEIRSRLGI